ncbi:SecDF P1 head subdomain-containing protein [Lentibacillus salinarum]|uniref:SecDF P1 head subdomain domain-containing protein n=1 Tax=Lentibacillus salinarum TaxID=446820 RepID=A0ABW3ZSI1_9BACI
MAEENKLKEITENHLDGQIHIYLGDELLSSPHIKAVMDGESFQFTGKYAEDKAEKFIEAVKYE